MKSAFCLFTPPFLNGYSMQNLGESQSMQREKIQQALHIKS